MISQGTVDQLKVSLFEDKLLLSSAAADLAEEYINQAIQDRCEAVIILATGASQFEFLESLTQRQIEWQKVVAFHLDEYVGITEDHPASFRRYLTERIIDRVGIGQSYLICGDCEDIQAECTRLDKLFQQYTVDVAFTGIGENGHLAFNDPPASFDDHTNFKVVRLDDACRRQQLGEGWFNTLEDVPQDAITMTIKAIMRAKNIICCVPDRRKAEAVRKTLIEEVSPGCPASILRRHPNSTLLIDQASASLLPEALFSNSNNE
jgi:glucosamine-6-phosphate deaminase